MSEGDVGGRAGETGAWPEVVRQLSFVISNSCSWSVSDAAGANDVSLDHMQA